MINQAEIERRVQAVLRTCHKLEELARLETEVFVADERLPVCAERYLHLACEGCIEIGLLLISGLRRRRPDCYEAIAEVLTEAGFGPADYAPQIERIVKLRNMLVHTYSSIDPRALHNQLAPRVMELEFFANQATTFVRRVI
jgi:uncharacterized protein YutE (UPF0331/DUF86 family)